MFSFKHEGEVICRQRSKVANGVVALKYREKAHKYPTNEQRLIHTPLPPLGLKISSRFICGLNIPQRLNLTEIFRSTLTL